MPSKRRFGSRVATLDWSVFRRVATFTVYREKVATMADFRADKGRGQLPELPAINVPRCSTTLALRAESVSVRNS